MSASDDGVREGPAQPTRERVCPYTDVGPSLSPLRVAHLGSEPARGREKVTDDRGDVGIGDVYRHAGIRHQPIVAQSPVRDTPLAVLLDEAILVLARAEDLVAGGSGQSDHAGAAPGGDVPVDLVEDPWSSGGPARRGHAHLRIRVMRAAPDHPAVELEGTVLGKASRPAFAILGVDRQTVPSTQCLDPEYLDPLLIHRAHCVAGGGDVNPARTGASVNVDRRCAAGNRRALRRSQTRVPRIRQGSAKSAGTRCCHVRQQRQGGRAVRGAGLVEIRVLVDRATVGVASVSLAHATVAAGAETVWHRLQATDEIYFVLSGRGLVSVGDESGEVGPGDAVWIPAGVPQKIRALGSVPLTFLCACGPAYLPERDQRMGEAAVIGAWP